MPVPSSAEQWQQHWVDEMVYFRANPRDTVKSFSWAYPRWKAAPLIEMLNLYLEGDEVARGTKKPNPAPARGNQWTEFVDIPLSEDDFDEIGKAFPDFDAVNEAVTELVEKGYRVSLSFNQGNDAFIASVTCKDTESPNNGKTFNAFAGSWLEALQCALYKHYVKTGRVWGGSGEKPARPRFG